MLNTAHDSSVESNKHEETEQEHMQLKETVSKVVTGNAAHLSSNNSDKKPRQDKESARGPLIHHDSAVNNNSNKNYDVDKYYSKNALQSGITTNNLADIDVKESELRQAVRNRITELENELADRNNQLLKVELRLHTIEEDYEFNYNLIKERDAALQEALSEITQLHNEISSIACQSESIHNKWQDAELTVNQLRNQLHEIEVERDDTIASWQNKHLEELQTLQAQMLKERNELEEELAVREQRYSERVRLLEATQSNSSTSQKEYLEHVESTHQTELTRLHNALNDMTRQFHQVSELLHDMELSKQQLVEQLEHVKRENVALVNKCERHQDEVEHARSLHATELEELNAQMHSATLSLEETIREERNKTRQLTQANYTLHKQLCELQEKEQRLTLQHDEEQESFLEQINEHAARCVQTHSDMRKLQEQYDKNTSTLQLQVETHKQKVKELEELVMSKEAELQILRQELQQTKDKFAHTDAELQLCKKEVERYKQDALHSTILSEKNSTSWSAQCQELSESLRESNEQLHELKMKHNEKVEQLQSETMRLTRELHSSEAARRVLEDQLHLSCDVNAQTASCQTLRSENELLQRQVRELTSANAEIRLQIGHFANELQNDPLILSAKEMQSELQHVKEELARANNENVRLKDNVKGKENEINRYQLDLLRLQMLQSPYLVNKEHEESYAKQWQKADELSREASLPLTTLLPHKQLNTIATTTAVVAADNNNNNNNYEKTCNGTDASFAQQMERMYNSLRSKYDKLRASLHHEKRQRRKWKHKGQQTQRHYEQELKTNTSTKLEEEQNTNNVANIINNKNDDENNNNKNNDNNSCNHSSNSNKEQLDDSHYDHGKNKSSTDNAKLHKNVTSEKRNNINSKEIQNRKTSVNAQLHKSTSFTSTSTSSSFTSSSSSRSSSSTVSSDHHIPTNSNNTCLSKKQHYEERYEHSSINSNAEQNYKKKKSEEEYEEQPVESSSVMNEAELWRRKYFVLENSIRALLRERDNLERELRQAKHEIIALRSEKQSLIDLNSLLKAQVREAYKLQACCHSRKNNNNSNNDTLTLSKVHATTSSTVADKERDIKEVTRNEISHQSSTRQGRLDEESVIHKALVNTEQHTEIRNTENIEESEQNIATTSHAPFDTRKARELLITAMNLLYQPGDEESQSAELAESKELLEHRSSLTEAKATSTATSMRIANKKKDSLLARKGEVAPPLEHLYYHQHSRKDAFANRNHEDNIENAGAVPVHVNTSHEDEQAILDRMFHHENNNRLLSLVYKDNVNNAINNNNSSNIEQRQKTENLLCSKTHRTSNNKPSATQVLTPSAFALLSSSSRTASQSASLVHKNKTMPKGNKPVIVRRGNQGVRHYGITEEA